MGEQYRIREYPLIILFIVIGAAFLVSTSDLVSIFLSIELQSYGLYLLSTLYRNSEKSTSGGLTYFLLGGLSSCFIVRRCAYYYYESKRFSYCPYITPASELGVGESPTLNIASLPEGGKGPKLIGLVVHRAEPSKSKAILPEPYLPGTSTGGSYQFRYRICALVCGLGIKNDTMDQSNQGTICTHKIKSRGSKDGLRKIVIGTAGLPTVLKDHGNRGAIVPSQGRASGFGVCSYSTSAGSSSTVSTDGLGKLQKIYHLCKENKNFVVIDKLYRLLYDKDLYYAAASHKKLKSKPGNMSPGIIPTTLYGMSEESIVKIIDSLKDGTFKFQPGRRIYIPKANGDQRTLTLAPPRDKLVQECIRMILEAIYEPTFYENSHGFRPNRSCHTALRSARQKFVMAK